MPRGGGSLTYVIESTVTDGVIPAWSIPRGTLSRGGSGVVDDPRTRLREILPIRREAKKNRYLLDYQFAIRRRARVGRRSSSNCIGPMCGSRFTRSRPTPSRGRSIATPGVRSLARDAPLRLRRRLQLSGVRRRSAKEEEADPHVSLRLLVPRERLSAYERAGIDALTPSGWETSSQEIQRRHSGQDFDPGHSLHVALSKVTAAAKKSTTAPW